MIRNGQIKIGIAAPGRPVGLDVPAKIQELAGRLYGAAAPEIWFHPQCFQSSGHFAGPDAARAQAFIDIANDERFDAFWFGRGGYGSFRIIEAVLPQLTEAARRKVYLGYSDAGSLLGALYGRGFRVAHGPMPQDINRAGGEAAVARALSFLTNGGGVESSLGAAPVAAFNLTILGHLAGTPFMPDLSGHILMIEEVSEAMYRIDRTLGQVVSAVRGLAGLMLGRCSDIPANDPDFGCGEEDVAQDWCARAGIPYLGRADIGHDVDNKVAPFGTWRP